MPLDLSQSGITPNIESEVESASLSVIDLVEVDLGLGYKRRWSNRQVDFSWVSGQLDGDYEARILNISERRWSLGPDDDSVTLLIGNADGAISRMSQEFGIDIFEGAKVRLHRLFPAIKEVYKDYWVGTGEPIVISEGAVEWVITFGISRLKRKFGRQYSEFNCPHVFAGGPSSDCPYSLDIGIGEPEKKIVAIAAAGTSNSRIVVSNDTFQASMIGTGWYVFSRNSNAYAKVDTVDSQTQLSISFLANGEGGRSFRAGDTLIIGPPLLDCTGKNPASCKERGMFGKHGGNPTGSGSKRRYYGGDTESARVRFSGRIPSGRGNPKAGDRFTRTALGNDSISGTVVPVIFGFYRIRDVPSTYHAPAGDFQHGLFILCEGEIVDFNALDVNGFPPDYNVPEDLDSLNEIIRNDAYIKWGTWEPGGIDDSSATNINMAKQVRQAIGRRKSVAIRSGSKIIDTYGNGVDSEGVECGNPYLFNTGAGDGTSQHGLAVARIRIETQQDIQTALTGSFDIFGLLVPLPQGMANNERDRDTYNLTVDGTTLRYTANPNPIQVAYALLTNERWGAGLPSSSIDIDGTIRESNYCEERIGDVDSAYIDVVATVYNPASHLQGTAQNPVIFLEDVRDPTNSLIGRTITFNKGSPGASQAIIIANVFHEVFQEDEVNQITMMPVSTNPGEREGNIIQLDRPLPPNVMTTHVNDPRPTGEILGGYFTKRFEANGSLADRVPIPDMLQTVLDNCNGTYRTNGDKLEFIIRKELSPTEIDTIIRGGIFTDRGAIRNIIRASNGGESTMQVWRDLDTDIGNFFSVTFRDRNRSFQESIVTVTNDAAQKRAAKLFGDEEGREKIEDQLDLILTTSKGQAARLLALRARELYIQNMYCSFETSLKRGMKTQPGDIIAVDSERISGLFNILPASQSASVGNAFLFRVLEKVETGTFTIKLTCKVHINSIYSDHATDFVQFFGPTVAQREKGVLPAQFTPLPATETVVVHPDGSPRSIITVGVTYPSLGVEPSVTTPIVPGVPTLPAIDNFEATPASINEGDSSTLSWETSDADKVRIDNGIGAVAREGIITVSPTQTTTYNITATNEYGEVTDTSTVTIRVAPDPTVLPTIDHFFVSSTVIPTGGSVVVFWGTTGATSVLVTAGTNTISILPDGSTPYAPGLVSEVTIAVSATNSAGTVTDSRTVTVIV